MIRRIHDAKLISPDFDSRDLFASHRRSQSLVERPYPSLFQPGLQIVSQQPRLYQRLIDQLRRLTSVGQRTLANLARE
jgi:hypothetical protein